MYCNEKSQGSIAKHLRYDELLYYTFIIQSAGERIFKIEHLANLQAKSLIVSCTSFTLHFCPRKMLILPDKLNNLCIMDRHTHMFNGPFSATTQVSRYQKAKPIWILLKQETVSGSGISWAICKCASRFRQKLLLIVMLIGRLMWLFDLQTDAISDCQTADHVRHLLQQLFFVAAVVGHSIFIWPM